MKIKLQYVVTFLAGIYAASISAMANADWSIKLLGGADALILDAAIGVSDINDSGQAVGVYTFFGDADRSFSFITGPDGIGMSDVSTSQFYPKIHPTGINDSGQVTGWGWTDRPEESDAELHGFSSQVLTV